jgi:hypothetical protein
MIHVISSIATEINMDLKKNSDSPPAAGERLILWKRKEER